MEQEKGDNKRNPSEKKTALKSIIRGYNKQYGTNRNISKFGLYYQDVQKHIKDQQCSNADYPHKNRTGIIIVVDMLLTGFNSKYLNALYVGKNLGYHGLVQAFSRTNRILDNAKPYGGILGFRHQKNAANEVITLFSREKSEEQAKKAWLVNPTPVAVEKYKEAVVALGDFIRQNNLTYKPREVYDPKGDTLRIAFVKNFREVQRLKTQLDQYTDLNEEQRIQIEEILPENTFCSSKNSYIEMAKQFREVQQKGGDNIPVDI